MDLTVEDLAKTIDHTVLKPEAKQSKIKQLCEEARMYEFAAVCINTTHVEYAADLLKGSSVKVCCVIGFPLGANLTQVKAMEAREAVRLGAHEIDMVINVGALRDKNYEHQSCSRSIRRRACESDSRNWSSD
jgi:deoxyribose-phosphate aldolase